jgi:hypothetical protein
MRACRRRSPVTERSAGFGIFCGRALILCAALCITGGCGAGHDLKCRMPHLQVFSRHDIGPRMVHDDRAGVSVETTKQAGLQEKSLSGSDGTRTRDLRRDRPNRVRRQPRTNESEQPHLQGVFAFGQSPFRMAAWILQPGFGPRMGHAPCGRVRLQTGRRRTWSATFVATRSGGGPTTCRPPPIATLATQPQLLLCPARFGPSSGSSLLRAGLLSVQIAS